MSEQFVTVRIGQERYGLPIEAVETIVRWESLTRLPRMPRFLAGLYNLRGRAIPVMDLRKRLDLPAESCGSAQRIVFIRMQDTVVGLIVDGVCEVLSVEAGQIESKVPLLLGETTPGGDYLRGVANLPQGFLILFDLECLLSAGEQTQLSKLEAKTSGAAA